MISLTDEEEYCLARSMKSAIENNGETCPACKGCEKSCAIVQPYGENGTVTSFPRLANILKKITTNTNIDVASAIPQSYEILSDTDIKKMLNK